MPRITSLAQQHRHSIGDHTAREDAKQRTQVAQDEFTRKLADRPGLNRGNVQQQQNAATLLQLFSYLTTARNTPSTMVDPPFLSRPQEDVPVRPTADSGTHAETTSLSTALGGVRNALVAVGNFVEQNDPLTFSGADAAPMDNGRAQNLFALERQRRQAPDDYAVERKMLANYCDTEEFAVTFVNVMRQTGRALKAPVTHIAMIIKTESVFGREGRCPTLEEVRDLINITTKIDAVISLIIPFIPGLNYVALAQSIVGPLLVQAADAIEDKPTSVGDQQDLVLQLGMAARTGVSQLNRGEIHTLERLPHSEVGKPASVDMPKYHFEDGVAKGVVKYKDSQVKAPIIEVGGKIYAEVLNKRVRRLGTKLSTIMFRENGSCPEMENSIDSPNMSIWLA